MFCEVGQYEFELKHPSAFRALIAAPLFLRYSEEVRGVRKDVITKIRALLDVQVRTPEMEKDLESLYDVYTFEKNRMLASFISRLDANTTDMLMKFICKDVLVGWNLEMPINQENLLKIPPLVFLQLFEEVGNVVLSGNGDDINFLPKKSQKQVEESTEEARQTNS